MAQRLGETTRFPPMWPKFGCSLALSLFLALAILLGFSLGSEVYLTLQKPTSANFNWNRIGSMKTS